MIDASSSSLRERRRRQTATEIQRATLNLILHHGLDSVTTEMIAASAGISLRTFFNYFPNKEAAAAGSPPEFPDAAVARFVSGTGTFAEGLAEILDAQISVILSEHEVIWLLIRVSREHPRLLILLDDNLRHHRGKMAQILAQRMPDANPATLAILADLLIACVREEIERLASGTAQPADHTGGTLARLREIGAILTSP